jgi:hypothetical protein
MFRMLATALVWASLGGLAAAMVGPGPRAHVKPFSLEESCKPENRAAAADALLPLFHDYYVAKVKEAFASIGGPAMLTIGDGHSNGLFFNFMAHVNRTVVEEKANLPVVNVALDEMGMKGCEATQKRIAATSPSAGGFMSRLRRKLSGKKEQPTPVLKCLSLEGWLPSELSPTDQAAGVRGTGTCRYNIIIWTKPHILKVALEASSHGVLMIDTDVVVRKDILKESVQRLTEKKGASIVTGIENTRADRINTGTVFITPTGRMYTEIMEEWIKENSNYLNDDHGDQAALQAVFLTNHRLNQFAVTYGESVGQCSRPAPVATHYNCYANKLAPMKSQGDWDVATQTAREQLGLHNEKGFSKQSEWLQQKIESLEASGEWMVPNTHFE